jgi:hypothetical protein
MPVARHHGMQKAKTRLGLNKMTLRALGNVNGGGSISATNQNNCLTHTCNSGCNSQYTCFGSCPAQSHCPGIC